MRIACNADLQICDRIFCPICCKTRGHEAYKLLLLKVFVTSSLVYLMFSESRCKELFEAISLLFFHSKDGEDVDSNEEQANEAKEKREEKGKGKKQGDDKESEKNEKKRRNDEENRNEGEKGQ